VAHDDARFTMAMAAIDEANAGDPNTIVVDGEVRPKELAHAELMVEEVLRLDPDATEEQLLAARAHHLRRWTVPRSSYPEGRSGYLRWRAGLRERHATEVAEILVRAGYDQGAVARVQQIVRKQGLASDPAVQTHEDALCLVFLRTQLAGVAAQLGEEKGLDVLVKTMKKMSAAGLAAAAALDLGAAERELVGRAAALVSPRSDHPGGAPR
jgi:hypothetical protein